jgi:hypothetical protein
MEAAETAGAWYVVYRRIVSGVGCLWSDWV